ncbi:cytochrome b [Phaeovulum sp. W22_SRMD_FR3]|uniref:cytochrome b n=1 Tax=Phaeovulum sp. W22_SRMD_FR3 TaxID=3240274 RepID=UPI003F9884B1
MTSPTAARIAPVLWRDTPERYGLISRFLHWGMAALILWQFLGMTLKLTLGRVPLAGFFVSLHAPVGVLLFLLILARIGWALAMRHRRPAQAAGLAGLAARAGHAALYLLMLVIPALALLRAYGSERAFSVFGITLFPAGGAPVEWMVTAGQLLHGTLAWTLCALVGGHIAMALLHQALWRDGTLTRMAGRFRARV